MHELSRDNFYTKGAGRWSSSCIACELARKKERWFKKKKKKSRTQSRNIFDLNSCEILSPGQPDWALVREKFREISEEVK